MKRACILILVALAFAGCAVPSAPPAPAGPTPTLDPTVTGVLPELVVAEPDPARPAYVRAEWGGGWADADGDGCNTRAEVLQLESAVPTGSKPTNCTVVTGDWTDPYTGQHTTRAADLQIDHLVAVGDAARSGGWRWDAARKSAFANNLDDPMELNATIADENTRKADSGPDQWLPPNPRFVCTYIASYVRIKAQWGLTVSAAQHTAIVSTWNRCLSAAS